MLVSQSVQISILRLIELIHFQTDNITGRILHAHGVWQTRSSINANLQEQAVVLCSVFGLLSRSTSGLYALRLS
jgi:hypothetical protein